MTKIYPRWSTAAISPVPHSNKSDKSFDNADAAKNLTTLTVWKKSLLFNCDGFTVFDAQGNLVYRVDSYLSGSDIVLMDASGNSLLTIRRKKWKLGVDNAWMVFKGDEIKNPIFCMRKNTNFLGNNTCLAYLSSPDHNNVHKSHVYEIEGSYGRRCCGVYDDKGRKVAEIKQKEAPVKGVAFGMDIFSLVIQPGLIDTSLAMAIVIMLDQIFGSPKTSPRKLLTNFKS